jgi:hypothetical protein
LFYLVPVLELLCSDITITLWTDAFAKPFDPDGLSRTGGPDDQVLGCSRFSSLARRGPIQPGLPLVP